MKDMAKKKKIVPIVSSCECWVPKLYSITEEMEGHLRFRTKE